MPFYITVTIDRKQYRMLVEKVHETPTLEHYKVSGKDRNITLQTNRKLFISKGLKHRTGTWKLIAGKLTNSTALDAITKAIDNAL